MLVCGPSPSLHLDPQFPSETSTNDSQALQESKGIVPYEPMLFL